MGWVPRPPPDTHLRLSQKPRFGFGFFLEAFTNAHFRYLFYKWRLVLSIVTLTGLYKPWIHHMPACMLASSTMPLSVALATVSLVQTAAAREFWLASQKNVFQNSGLAFISSSEFSSKCSSVTNFNSAAFLHVNSRHNCVAGESRNNSL